MWILLVIGILIPITFNSCKAFIAPTENGLTISGQIDNSSLGVLKDLQGVVISESEIRLIWSLNMSGNFAFSIFRNDQYIATTTDTRYVDLELIANTKYTYKVYAADIDTGQGYASGVIVLTTPESGQVQEPTPEPTPDPTPEPIPDPAPTEPPMVCTPNTTTKINCTSEIAYASTANKTRTCNSDGSGYTTNSCLLESCLNGYEVNGNTCTPVANEPPPSTGITVSYSEDGGRTYSLLDSNSRVNTSSIVVKFDNVSEYSEISVYCCKGFDSQNNAVGTHSIVSPKRISASQPTISLDLSSLTQDLSRELYYDAIKTGSSLIKSGNTFFRLSQDLLNANQSTSAPTGGSGGNTGTVGDSSGWTYTMDFEEGTSGNKITVPGWNDSTAVYSSSASVSGKMSGRTSITAGATAFGKWGGIITHPSKVQRYGEIWFRVRTFFPSGFDYTAGPHLKFLRVHVRSDAEANQGYNDLYVNNPGTSNPYQFIYEGEQVWSKIGAPSDAIQTGVWETYEMYVKLDTVPVSKGGQARVIVWKNGKRLKDITDRITLYGSNSYSERSHLFTYWNGGAPKSQYMYFDDLVITTKQPAARDSSGFPMIGK